jgi:hypothetical protein
VNDKEVNEVSTKRNLAALKLIELCEKDSDNSYTALDFMLDRLLREIMELPRKSPGKAPYDFLDF